MGTQTNVKFSRILIPIDRTLKILEENTFNPLQIVLKKWSLIQPSNDMDIPGYDAVGKLSQVRTAKEVLEKLNYGESFALGYQVNIPANIYLNFFEFDSSSYSLLLTFDSSLLYYCDDENEPGDILDLILTRITDTLEIDVCGYNCSNRFFGKFDPLTINEIVDGLLSGELLRIRVPFYYAILGDHISAKELRQIAFGTVAKYKLYGNHHILSAWLVE